MSTGGSGNYRPFFFPSWSSARVFPLGSKSATLSAKLPTAAAAPAMVAIAARTKMASCAMAIAPFEASCGPWSSQSSVIGFEGFSGHSRSRTLGFSGTSKITLRDEKRPSFSPGGLYAGPRDPPGGQGAAAPWRTPRWARPSSRVSGLRDLGVPSPRAARKARAKP